MNGICSIDSDTVCAYVNLICNLLLQLAIDCLANKLKTDCSLLSSNLTVLPILTYLPFQLL